MFWKAKTTDGASTDLETRLKLAEDRLTLWGERSGVGLWEAYMYEADAFHEKSVWVWSPEFRRLCGYKDETDYPNVVHSWFDALHPDDVDKTVAAFAGHLEDKTGNTQYDTTYRLKMPDGSYKWFRATGGCKYEEDGIWVRACGSLVCIHESMLLQQQMEQSHDDDEKVMALIGEALAAVARGDFTHRIGAEMPAKGAKLRDDFNDAGLKVGSVMRTLIDTTQLMIKGSGDINGAVGELSSRTESQAAALEQSAAALVEMTETVKQSADGATKTASITHEAKTSAENSGEVVANAVTAMDEISKSSEEINRIIGVIDAIAFQTNLLALNASVEAARAGEAGKGFAVVAHEVRELAQRSANAAQEIKSLISKSGDQVQSGVKLVGETGQALEGIVEQVVKITGFVDEIASSTREQSSGLSEINNSVTSMDQMTQQNAAMVSHTSGLAETLAEHAAALAEAVSHFKLDETAQSRAA